MKRRKGLFFVITTCFSIVLAVILSHVLTVVSAYETGISREVTVAFPMNYRNQFKHYVTVECSNMQSLRKMYVSSDAVKVLKSTREIAGGTVLVMETISAVKGGGDRLTPTQIQSVFIRRKDKDGNWRSAWYSPSGSLISNNQSSCIGCHNSVKNRDFMFTLPSLMAFVQTGQSSYQKSEFNTSVCR